MIAPSFQKFDILGEPYDKNGKMYIDVRNPKTGTVRSCRWYTEKEYYRAYPVKAESRKPQKDVLGFTKGYITIFEGEDEEWFSKSICRFARPWGWYLISTEEMPSDLPIHLKPHKLPWELVGEPNGNLKPEDEVQQIVKKLLNHKEK